MINTNLVKAILSFYLQVRLKQWKIPTDEKLALPTDEKSLNKIKLVCGLYFNLCHNANNREFLLNYCDKLEKDENKERENHRSYYAPALFDYPLMANVIRALRSHILSTAQPHAENPSELYSFLNKSFLNIIKYEDHHYLGNKFQEVGSIANFVDTYKKDASSFSLLDRVYLLRHKAKQDGQHKSSYAETLAGGVLGDVMSDNKTRNANIATLFANKAERKAVKQAAAALNADKVTETNLALK